MDRKTDRPYFIGPLWLPPEVQKVSENLKEVVDTKYDNFDNPVFLNMKWFDPQTWYQKQQEAGKITSFYEQFKEKLDHVNF